jgi:hypothetical protein
MYLVNDAKNLVCKMLDKASVPTFYHYYPLLCALSDSSFAPLFSDEVGRIWSDAKELLFQPEGEVPKEVENILIATDPLDGWKVEPYDNNYIYDLDQTMKIKNFRMNVKKFEQDVKEKGQEWVWKRNMSQKDILELLKQWYSQYGKDVTDYGYTSKLVEEWNGFKSDKFDELGLQARALYIDDKIVSLSMWGKLCDGMAVYIVCKSLKAPYISYFVGDFVRWNTYIEMISYGYRYVNDGGDLGLEGLKKYKMKFRPVDVIDIYSLVRT